MRREINRKLREWSKQIIYAVYLIYCRFRFGQNIRIIPLTKFKFVIVDSEDFDRISKFTWYARFSSRSWYAVRCKRRGESGNILVWMHNMIVPPPRGLMVDHANHNGLDNRKTNLRLATWAQNMQNRRRSKVGCTSKYKGVIHRNFHNRRKLWYAYINANRRRIHLGCYMTELEAALEYDRAAVRFHGQFACLNFPKKSINRKDTKFNKVFSFRSGLVALLRV
jgi:hypothetical protein